MKRDEKPFFTFSEWEDYELTFLSFSKSRRENGKPFPKTQPICPPYLTLQSLLCVCLYFCLSSNISPFPSPHRCSSFSAPAVGARQQALAGFLTLHPQCLALVEVQWMLADLEEVV